MIDDGKIIYYYSFLKNTKNLYKELKYKIPWQYFYYKIYNINVKTPRLMHIIYFPTKINLPNLNKIKNIIENITRKKFKYAVLNYYRDGLDYIGFHSDREVNKNEIVASLSIGDSRKFVLKHIYQNIKYKFNISDAI